METDRKTPELGEVVGLHEERPVHMNRAGTTLIPGDSHFFLDLRLVNHLGREKIVRVPVPEAVFDFYSEGAEDVGIAMAAALQTAKG